MTEESFVRLRQALVTAHEVGHTLGFPHAWNASMNDRASVMEYPSPRLKLTTDGKIDLSDAFESSIGDFDNFMVRYSYSDFPAAQEKQDLEEDRQRRCGRRSCLHACDRSALGPLRRRSERG